MKALPIAFALLAFACSSDPECDGTEVTITRGKSTLLRVCAEVRDTEAGRARGLSGHAPLAKDEGMLLDFPVEGEVCIVNTDVSFDTSSLAQAMLYFSSPELPKRMTFEEFIERNPL